MIWKFIRGGYQLPGKFGTIINVETAYPRGILLVCLEAAINMTYFIIIFLNPTILGHYEGFLWFIEKHDILMEYTQKELGNYSK